MKSRYSLQPGQSTGPTSPEDIEKFTKSMIDHNEEIAEN
jgi:hypothetical protein